MLPTVQVTCPWQQAAALPGFSLLPFGTSFLTVLQICTARELLYCRAPDASFACFGLLLLPGTCMQSRCPRPLKALPAGSELLALASAAAAAAAVAAPLLLCMCMQSRCLQPPKALLAGSCCWLLLLLLLRLLLLGCPCLEEAGLNGCDFQR